MWGWLGCEDGLRISSRSPYTRTHRQFTPHPETREKISRCSYWSWRELTIKVSSGLPANTTKVCKSQYNQLRSPPFFNRQLPLEELVRAKWVSQIRQSQAPRHIYTHQFQNPHWLSWGHCSNEGGGRFTDFWWFGVDAGGHKMLYHDLSVYIYLYWLEEKVGSCHGSDRCWVLERYNGGRGCTV